jgi:hypothetical protein
MLTCNIGSVLIVDEAGMLVGIFSERDLLKKVVGIRADYPDLPIRGRYLSLQLIVDTEGFALPKTRGELSQSPADRRVRLEVRNGKLVAVKDDDGDYGFWFAPAPGVAPPPLPAHECGKEPPDKQAACWEQQNAEQTKAPIDFPIVAVLQQPVLYFIPEHAEDPTPRRSEASVTSRTSLPSIHTRPVVTS